MNKKNGTKICAMILIVVFIAQVGAGATRPSLSSNPGDELNGKGQRLENESQVIMLSGSITANLCNGSGGVLKNLIYPSIDMPGEQALSINTTKDNDSWVVNASLRIWINKGDASQRAGSMNKSYLIKRCLTIFAVVIRKNQPLISGVLRDLFLGRSFTRINVFSPNSSDYVDIPLIYSTKKQDEEQRVFIFAIGSLMGLLAESPPIFAMKTIDLSCHYSTATEDSLPPFTTIVLTGEEIGDNVFSRKAMVSFLSNDELSTVACTSYSYTFSNEQMMYQSSWMTYDEPTEYDNPGLYVFSYYSEDSAGNVEPVKTESFNIQA
jgi:hypothetical protein